MRGRFLGLLTVWILLVGASPDMKVQVNSDRLTVQVREIALSEVLEAIEEQANVTFTVIAADYNGEVNVSDDFTNLPLEQGIARLMGRWDYALVRDKETMRLKEIYIVARAENDQVSSSIQQQIEALSRIDDFQDAQALEALRQALQSINPEVRLTALEIMDLQKVRDRTALEVARQLSITDPHPEVRGKAHEIIRRHGPMNTISPGLEDAYRN